MSWLKLACRCQVGPMSCNKSGWMVSSKTHYICIDMIYRICTCTCIIYVYIYVCIYIYMHIHTRLHAYVWCICLYTCVLLSCGRCIASCAGRTRDIVRQNSCGGAACEYLVMMLWVNPTNEEGLRGEYSASVLPVCGSNVSFSLQALCFRMWAQHVMLTEGTTPWLRLLWWS